MASSNSLTEQRRLVAEAVIDHVHGNGATGANLVGSGEFSTAFSYEHQESSFIVRITRFDDDLGKDMVASAYRSELLPVPEVLAVGSIDAQTHWAISRMASGRHLATLPTGGIRRFVPSLLLVLDEMRKADVGTSSGYGHFDRMGQGNRGSWSEFILDESENDRVWGWVPVFESQGVDALYRKAKNAMRELVANCPESRHLIHADLINNTFVDESKVSAVFDFGKGMYGDFLYDIGVLSFLSGQNRCMNGIDIASHSARFFAATDANVENFRARVACYELHNGLADMRYWAATSQFGELNTAANRTKQVLDKLQKPLGIGF